MKELSRSQFKKINEIALDIKVANSINFPYINLGIAYEKQLLIDIIDSLTEPLDTEQEIATFLIENFGETYGKILSLIVI